MMLVYRRARTRHARAPFTIVFLWQPPQGYAIALVPVTRSRWFGAADRRVFLVSLGYLAALFLAMLAELAISR